MNLTQVMHQQEWEKHCFDAFDAMRDSPAGGRKIAEELYAIAKSKNNSPMCLYAEIMLVFALFLRIN